MNNDIGYLVHLVMVSATSKTFDSALKYNNRIIYSFVLLWNSRVVNQLQANVGIFEFVINLIIMSILFNRTKPSRTRSLLYIYGLCLGGAHSKSVGLAIAVFSWMWLDGVVLAVEEIGSHQELQSDLRSDGKFGNLRRAVCVPHFVCEIHAHLLQDM